LKKRGKNHREGIQLTDFFSPETYAELRRLFTTHFKTETEAENIRRKLHSFPNFNVFEAFNSID